MSPVTASCARCGADIVFRIDDAVVVVCEHCNTVNARTDRGFEDLGKVADLVDTPSPLQLWVEGRFRGVGFMIVGRSQFRHPAGGLWDEWYLKLDDGSWGWLAEAQGRFYVTFPLAEPGHVPPLSEMVPGKRIRAGGGELVVADVGEAEQAAAEGDIPYRLVPGRRFMFADLEAAGTFATVDYGDDPPSVYLGSEVTLEELGIDASALRPPEKRVVPASAMTCPTCGGALELRAPDRAERVACPYCDALLDVNQGQLVFLEALRGPRVRPQIPLGTTGTLDGHEQTVIGFMQRSVTFDRKYYWEEYLLYSPELGFRWLTCSDGHWSYVVPLRAGDVEASSYVSKGSTASYDGKTYRVFQDAKGTVEYVSGEFYWKVEAGEQADMCDYIRPPQMLSWERSGGEINYSLGTYETEREIEAAFGADVRHPQAGTVAPNQPYPHRGIYRVWAALAGLLFLTTLLVTCTRDDRTVLEKSWVLEPQTSRDQPTVLFTDPFVLKERQNVEIQVKSPVNNSWVYVTGDLFADATGVDQQFDVPVEYYHGYEDGESWSEGSQRTRRYLSALPGGSYTMRIAVERQRWNAPLSVTVRIKQGIFRLRYWWIALLILSIVPLLVGLHNFGFEKRRWADSDYAPPMFGQWDVEVD